MANLGVTSIQTNVTLDGFNETVAMISPPRDYENPTGQGVYISGLLNLFTAAGTASVIVRVRRGTDLSAPQVGAETTQGNLNGASIFPVPFAALDETTLIAENVQYCVTVTANMATADGSVSSGVMTTEPATSAS